MFIVHKVCSWKPHLSDSLSVIPQSEQNVRWRMGALSLVGIFVNVVAEVDL